MGGTTKQVSTTPQEIMPLRGSILDALQSGNFGRSAGTPGNPYNQSYMNSTRAMAPANNMPQLPAWGGGMSNAGFGRPMMPRPSAPTQTMGTGASPDFLDMLNRGVFTTGPSLDSFYDPNSSAFQNIRGGYEDMFTQRRGDALAQAKESSGNLTGTGYADNLGRTVQRSLADENALLSQLMQQVAMTQYGQEQSNAQNDASRFLQMLMGMSQGGVGPDQVVTQGGPGAILGPLFSGLGYGLGGPAGGFLGGLFGGGGGQISNMARSGFSS